MITSKTSIYTQQKRLFRKGEKINTSFIVCLFSVCLVVIRPYKEPSQNKISPPAP